MWHEARKQEKKLRGMIVDYRKRAERRREFYEKFKADPTQFIQVHGRPCKIYMDPTITTAADNSLMPWQGNKDTIIDRFDVRAHLDYIPEITRPSSSAESVHLDGDLELDHVGELNYERYRILVQNELTNLSEDKFLHQIYVEEQFGTINTKDIKSSKQPALPKAAISYNYEDSTPSTAMVSTYPKTEGRNDGEESDEDLDFDLLVNLNDLNTLQKVELNTFGTKYGMKTSEFMTFLTNDVRERENIKLMKQQEEEKQHMSGRKARRERRAYKDKQLSRRENWSPPSYAASSLEPTAEASKRSSSESDSPNSPERVTYITSFGPKPDGNSIFGPNLPNSYKKRASGTSRRRRNTTSSSSDERHRHRRSKKSSHSYRKRRRSSSSIRSRSSSSSSSSSDPRPRHRRHRRRSSSSLEERNRKSDVRREKTTKSHRDSSSEDKRRKRNHGNRYRSTSKGVGSGGGIKVPSNTSSKAHLSSGSSGSGPTSTSTKLTPQERLKRRMQLALNKQLKADKDAEKLRNERLEQERMDREETLREISIKYRRKERERRHEKAENSSDSRRSRSRSSSPESKHGSENSD